MINSKDLRIGNFVNSITLGIKEAVITGLAPSGKCFLKDTSTVDYIDQLEPIYITQEWLLNFGAEDFEDFYKLNAGKNRCLIVELYSDFIRLNYYAKWGNQGKAASLGSFEPLYIHQLQNIFFALTGEELSVKETDVENS